MSALGDLLELLHTAHDRFSALEATVRTWRHTTLADEALSRWQARQEPGSVSVLRSVHRRKGPSETPPPEVTEQVSRLWFERPSRLRREVESTHGEHTGVVVIDGDRWWTYHPAIGVRTNVRPDGTRSSVHKRAEADMNSFRLFGPHKLLGEVTLELLERRMHVERNVIHVRALPRESGERMHRHLWEGADDYEVLVDADCGVLLRIVARIGGREFAGEEATSVTFDGPLTEDVFAFTPPPGARVQIQEPGHYLRSPSRLQRWWWRLRLGP